MEFVNMRNSFVGNYVFICKINMGYLILLEYDWLYIIWRVLELE